MNNEVNVTKEVLTDCRQWMENQSKGVLELPIDILLGLFYTQQVQPLNERIAELEERLKEAGQDLELSMLSTRQKIDQLTSCEKALEERDARVEFLTKEVASCYYKIEKAAREKKQPDFDVKEFAEGVIQILATNLYTKENRRVIDMLQNMVCSQKPITLQQVLERHAAFARKAFGAKNYRATLTKLIGEAQECLENPSLDEFADILLCLLNAFSETHELDAQMLLDAAWAKIAINENRDWGKAKEDGTFQHVDGSEERVKKALTAEWQTTLQLSTKANVNRATVDEVMDMLISKGIAEECNTPAPYGYRLKAKQEAKEPSAETVEEGWRKIVRQGNQEEWDKTVLQFLTNEYQCFDYIDRFCEVKGDELRDTLKRLVDKETVESNYNIGISSYRLKQVSAEERVMLG